MDYKQKICFYLPCLKLGCDFCMIYKYTYYVVSPDMLPVKPIVKVNSFLMGFLNAFCKFKIYVQYVKMFLHEEPEGNLSNCL